MYLSFSITSGMFFSGKRTSVPSSSPSPLLCESKSSMEIKLSKCDRNYRRRARAIAEEIDVDLRNGLAHGLFWMDAFEIVYCEDIIIKNNKSIRLDELWVKTRNQSIVTQCLIKSIIDWYSGT